jgi:hypothetical protein
MTSSRTTYQGGTKVLAGGRRKRSGKRRMRGGMNAANPNSYSDGASYGLATNGTVPEQFMRTYGGPGSGPGVYTSVQGASVGGGRKRSKKGGFWGEIISQALVPFSILGMQQTYRRNKHGGKRTKRNRR